MIEFSLFVKELHLYENQDDKSTNMNRKKITTSKQAQLMAVAIIAASVAAAAAMIIGINNGQNLQKVMARVVYPRGTGTTATTNVFKTASASSSSTTAAAVKVVNTNQSTNKEFWINTVHLDGTTNINASVKSDTSPQNTPTHPPEKPPVNSTIPAGGGFRIVDPNKVGAWDFRSFTFAPDQIVVNQGDKVTLHFIGVQGAHHLIEVEGIDNFTLLRGQIHTVSFVPNNPGTIAYICHVHPPNMVGQILVLPKPAV